MLEILTVIVLAQQDPEGRVAPGHWPQWRGPARDNVSTETGLLKTWPEGGPKLLWKSEAAGDGSGPLSVAGGLVFAHGCKDQKYVITALNGAGQVVWETPIGPQTGEYARMRFLGQRSITVDDDRVYACTAQGRLVCLKSASGELLWEIDYAKDLSGRPEYVLGYCDAPLVEGDLLVCTPGGLKGTLAALDKKSGRVVWRSQDLKDPMPTTAIVAAEIGGVRQFVVLTMKSVAGVRSGDGRLLWREDFPGRTMVATTPIVYEDVVLATSGYGVGWHAFRLAGKDGNLQAELVYSGKQTRHHRSVTRVGDWVYAGGFSDFKCIELKTGMQAWSSRSAGNGAVLAADGHLILRGESKSGTVVLVEATPEGYREKGRFNPTDRSEEAPFSQPVLAGGRLYLRDVNLILCYDLRGPDYEEAPPVWRIVPQPATPAAHAPAPAKGTDAGLCPRLKTSSRRWSKWPGSGKTRWSTTWAAATVAC